MRYLFTRRAALRAGLGRSNHDAREIAGRFRCRAREGVPARRYSVSAARLLGARLNAASMWPARRCRSVHPAVLSIVIPQRKTAFA
jgi:hypothetical protein